MHIDQSIKAIRGYCLIVFFLPLLTINICLLMYSTLGNHDLYWNHDYSKKKISYTIEDREFLKNSVYTKKTFSNCPKYQFSKYIINSKNEKENYRGIFSLNQNNSFIIEQGESLNLKCIKNSKIVYMLIKNFNFLEKILIDIKDKSIVSFGTVKNPYLYGDVSISRTARYFPATLIFKPFIVLSAIFLFLYWKNNLNLLNKLTNNNASKKFFYFGLLSSIFLILHAIFLGVEFDSKLFKFTRRLVITLFIFFEVFAQIALTINLVKIKNELKNLINPTILILKIIFVSIVLFSTIISFIALSMDLVETYYKHVLEWNYFCVLLFYYLLSRLLWKVPQKNQAHTPFGA